MNMTKWYQNNVKLFFAILFIAPLGVYGLIKKETNKAWIKIIVLVLSVSYLGFYSLILFSIIYTSIVGGDKISYDSALTDYKRGKLEDARKSFLSINSESEYYSDALSKLKEIDSVLAVKETRKNEEIQAKEEQDLKFKQEILDIRNKWTDSVVKSWEGQFITGYKKDSKDSILFFLSKNASKSFQSNRDSHIPMLEKSYKSYMNKKLPNKNIGKITIDFIQDPKIKEEIKNQAERNEKFSKFFGFKGQHRNLERLIKNNMNDPDSYEHVNTRWEDKGSYLLIETTIRGTNAFGAKIIKTYRAKSDLEGNIFDVSE